MDVATGRRRGDPRPAGFIRLPSVRGQTNPAWGWIVFPRTSFNTLCKQDLFDGVVKEAVSVPFSPVRTFAFPEEVSENGMLSSQNLSPR
jgi:hypothetical protein